MVKYYNMIEGFQEIPDETSLLINITNCINNCKGCHSPFLREDIGTPLTIEAIEAELCKGAFSCVCFMGEGNDKAGLVDLINKVAKLKLKAAVYCGSDISPESWMVANYSSLTFLKTGSFKEKLGPINKKTTNQRLYKFNTKILPLLGYEDITKMFWKKEKD